MTGLLLAMGAGSPPVAGQHPWSTLAPDSLEIRMELNTALHDNFFQAPHGQPDTTVHAGGVRARFAENWLHVDGRFTLYDSFESTFGVGGGVRIDGGRQRLELGLDHDWRLPRLDGPDAVGRADVGVLRKDYRLRMGQPLELSTTARYRWERVGGGGPDEGAEGRGADAEPEAPEEWSDQGFVEAGGALRTRVFGRAFSPEVGFTRGATRDRGPDQDYAQEQWHAQVRSMPHERVYLSARLRLRDRWYPDADPDASNFRREDRRVQLTLLADLDVTDSVGWQLYYAWEDAVSTRTSRDFTTRTLSMGLTLRSP